MNSKPNNTHKINNELIDSWKTSDKTFIHQLNRNIYELNNKYPPNWKHFISRLKLYPEIRKVVDIGCGAGSLYKLCEKHFPHIKYVGFDYSKHAIKLAKKTWNVEQFYISEYQDITSELFDNQETLLVANALADVLPNGDECIKFLLDLKSKYVHLQRVKITDKLSYYETYNAYDIKTYAFYHNWNMLCDIILDKNYKMYLDNYSTEIKDIFLIKNDE